MDKQKLINLSKKGFSIIPCDERKCPIGSWKKYQTEARNESEILNLNSPLYGIVTGYNNLEVLDIDLNTFITDSYQTLNDELVEKIAFDLD